MNGVDPPRGFAFAWFKIGDEDIGVYSVHLKSNLITHGDKEAEAAKNIQKREVAVTQLVAHVHDVIETTNGAHLRPNTAISDINIATTAEEVFARVSAYGDILVSSSEVTECKGTNRAVISDAMEVMKGFGTDGGVVLAGCVAKERTDTHGRIELAVRGTI